MSKIRRICRKIIRANDRVAVMLEPRYELVKEAIGEPQNEAQLESFENNEILKAYIYEGEISVTSTDEEENKESACHLSSYQRLRKILKSENVCMSPNIPTIDEIDGMPWTDEEEKEERLYDFYGG